MARWFFKGAGDDSMQQHVTTHKNMIPAPFLVVTIFALVVGSLSFIQIPCPTCGGTGILNTTTSLKADVASCTLVESVIPITCCDHPQVQYTYDVSFSVENTSAEPISGHITVSFFDVKPPLSYSDEIPADSVGDFPIQVDVPAGKTITVELSFIDVSDILGQPHTVKVQSGDTTTESVCPVCEGKGKLQFYSWLLAETK